MSSFAENQRKLLHSLAQMPLKFDNMFDNMLYQHCAEIALLY
jgi:hypothetical protein